MAEIKNRQRALQLCARFTDEEIARLEELKERANSCSWHDFILAAAETAAAAAEEGRRKKE